MQTFETGVPGFVIHKKSTIVLQVVVVIFSFLSKRLRCT